ncbi:fibroblast growth factor 20 isoform X4 [Pimephales promelas]|uniref:fibroblast growth factor 20 isoform X4 n=1 Tax=Pimephales promelas TaxID=90988 RepID=UPI001955EF4F|nr:fibroblast growth factor 20 isoform X4 [Pimephales promelas]
MQRGERKPWISLIQLKVSSHISSCIAVLGLVFTYRSWRTAVCGAFMSLLSLLRVFAMRPGIVGIRGVKSELYLCMNQEGIAHGMKKFSNECLFKESLEENHYNTYSSLRHTGFFLALSQQGKLRKGIGRHQACTHFLPRKPSSRLTLT